MLDVWRCFIAITCERVYREYFAKPKLGSAYGTVPYWGRNPSSGGERMRFMNEWNVEKKSGYQDEMLLEQLDAKYEKKEIPDVLKKKCLLNTFSHLHSFLP